MSMSKRSIEKENQVEIPSIATIPEKVISIKSLRESILGSVDTKIEPISIPEWNANLHIKALNAAERDEFEKFFYDDLGKRIENAPSSRAVMAYLSICDEDGERIFEKDDIQILSEKSGAALTRIFSKATALSGMTKDELDKLEKNSGAAPSGDSHSG